MYLKQVHIENNGPLRNLSVELPFSAEGLPKPVILAGANGSGKTNFLSIVVDALFEAAAQHYTDVVPGATTVHRNWFRIVGSTTISLGAKGSLSILRFEHDGKSYLYNEKGGTVSVNDARPRLDAKLRSVQPWPEEGAIKNITISGDEAGAIFDSGVYVYFPSSRSEVPNWLNQDSVRAQTFDLSGRFIKRLSKPIYAEKGLENFCQWISTIILESRADVKIKHDENGKPVQFELVGNWPYSVANLPVLGLANEILGLILNQPSARFVWAGRRNPNKIAIEIPPNSGVPSLDSLSAGQSTLLTIFGTLLRYGDNGPHVLSASNISGICLVDEIDAHMHVDLQYRALPQLIKMFPKIQFIVSSHSPLFALGMENEFGAKGVALIEMPGGLSIQAESYTEFGRAFSVLQETKAFAKSVAEIAGQSGKLLVLCEGETDPAYLRAAAELLQRPQILEKADIEWIGSKDASNNAFHTGKNALNHTLAMLRANPSFVKREVLLLYDCDARKLNEDYDHVHVRSLPLNQKNPVIEAGIENLLPNDSITDDFWDKHETRKPDGTKVETTSINKTKLCKYICAEKKSAADFVNFHQALDLIEALLGT